MHAPRKPDLRFETKAESNARREREFLALSPSERLLSFLRSFDLPHVVKGWVEESKGNFIIRRRKDALRG
ncbi:MAG: hypothetical protein KIT10_12150 [Flavobacteriales bacterium]|nr:hypothetical protein [Flavobacteriales bacterium]